MCISNKIINKRINKRINTDVKKTGVNTIKKRNKCSYKEKLIQNSITEINIEVLNVYGKKDLNIE
jgi:hypothetical protein